MTEPIPLFRVFLPPAEELMPRLQQALYSGQISEGEPVYAFERGFAAAFGGSHLLAFSSGTAALHIALLLAGVGSGDEVISTAMTAEPTNMAIRHAGASVVWADVDPANGLLDPASVEARITPRTRAILVVHYGGLLAPMARLNAVAAAYGIPVIQDAAHALGARYAGLPLADHSAFTMYSLQAIKHMTTVDGGMLACANSEAAARGRRLRWFGIDRQAPRTQVAVREVGFKYNMTNVTATLGLAQLDAIAPVLARHRANGAWLEAALAGLDGIRPALGDPAGEPAHWFFTVLAERRDDLSRHLTARGIENSLVHRRNDLHPVFAASRTALPGLDAYTERVLHLPCGWWVTDADRERIAEALRQGW